MNVVRRISSGAVAATALTLLVTVVGAGVRSADARRHHPHHPHRAPL